MFTELFLSYTNTIYHRTQRASCAKNRDTTGSTVPAQIRVMATTVFRPGATALITGAASGIGFAVAQLCRTYGMNLVLVDIHADHLAGAHAALKDTPTAKTTTHVMDVSDMQSWEFLREKVFQYFPRGIDLLFLNAGAGFKPQELKGPWEDPEYFKKV